ncbi:heavy-metal-associated domain-containing protein [Streptomyces heilongjiangensis]|uniref:Heavy-metal-associated domain-containing protein n=1 Tax=Streptomyces heilongjiangensis TaxID=945052 RepID=A0ABW1BH87_9ACTN|nr:cation transporter [Streptomyces heilongjiangensis]MDC2950469.1 cation transporter [Streptomyces heilongjiangensis]
MSCCTPDGSCSTTAAPAAGSGITTVYNVSGMTCGHCEAAVTKAVGALEGVTAVTVDVTGGRVSITSNAEPDDATVADAIDDAGYELVGRAD